jgi:hypothetical protein
MAITSEDIEFVRWVEHLENATYWVTDETGERIRMRDGWQEAEKEYKRIKTIKEILKQELARKYVDAERIADKLEK